MKISKLSTAQLVLAASGIVALLATFLPWASIGPFSINAWGDGMFPTYTWPGLFGAAAAALVVVPALGLADIPERLFGFTVRQIVLVLVAGSALLTVSFLIAGAEHAAGFWLTLAAAIGMVVGLALPGEDPAAVPDLGPTPPTPDPGTA